MALAEPTATQLAEHQALTDVTMAYLRATREGDSQTMRAVTRAATEYGNLRRDLSIDQSVAAADLRQAIGDRFGTQGVAAMRDLIAELPQPTGPMQWVVNGDLASPRPNADGIIEGPTRMVRVDGNWKVDLDLVVNEPINEQRVMTRRMHDTTALYRAVAAEVRTGQHATVADLRKSMRPRVLEATYGRFNPSGPATSTPPATQPRP